MVSLTNPIQTSLHVLCLGFIIPDGQEILRGDLGWFLGIHVHVCTSGNYLHHDGIFTSGVHTSGSIDQWMTKYLSRKLREVSVVNLQYFRASSCTI